MSTKAAKAVALLVVVSCIAALAPSALAVCDHSVEILDFVCVGETAGWFYNGTAWTYGAADPTALFKFKIDGGEFTGFCNDYEVIVRKGDKFNATIYPATPSCKNNSLAYLLNHWKFDEFSCANVSAGQSAVWYFSYLKEDVCEDGSPAYDHTTVPFAESRWIPDCTAHPLACTMINSSIDKSVPYKLDTTPASGTYQVGNPVSLTATVEYCLASAGEEVTIEFKTDKGIFNESGSSTYSKLTTGGKLTATLICDEEATAHVTAEIKDRYWFEVVNPLGCPQNTKDYQPTLKIITISDDASFNFVPGPQQPPEGALEGYIYQDKSCNCIREANETGVAGVTVELLYVNGTVARTTTTDANGHYLFTNLTLGNYTVRYDSSTLPVPFIPKCDDPGDYAKPTEGSVTVVADTTVTHNFAVTIETGISIEKLVNGVTYYDAQPNETVTIALTITNTGKVNLTDIKVHDAFPLKLLSTPNGLTFVSANPLACPASSTDGTWVHFTLDWPCGYSFGNLTPGNEFTITFKATVNPYACGMLKNEASVSAVHEWCTSPCTASDAAWVNVACDKVPVMTPIGILALVGLLSVVIALSTRKKE